MVDQNNSKTLLGISYEENHPTNRYKGIKSENKILEVENDYDMYYSKQLRLLILNSSLHQLNDIDLFLKLTITYLEQILNNINNAISKISTLNHTDTLSEFDGAALEIRSNITGIDEMVDMAIYNGKQILGKKKNIYVSWNLPDYDSYIGNYSRNDQNIYIPCTDTKTGLNISEFSNKHTKRGQIRLIYNHIDTLVDKNSESTMQGDDILGINMHDLIDDWIKVGKTIVLLSVSVNGITAVLLLDIIKIENNKDNFTNTYNIDCIINKDSPDDIPRINLGNNSDAIYNKNIILGYTKDGSMSFGDVTGNSSIQSRSILRAVKNISNVSPQNTSSWLSIDKYDMEYTEKSTNLFNGELWKLGNYRKFNYVIYNSTINNINRNRLYKSLENTSIYENPDNSRNWIHMVHHKQQSYYKELNDDGDLKPGMIRKSYQYLYEVKDVPNYVDFTYVDPKEQTTKWTQWSASAYNNSTTYNIDDMVLCTIDTQNIKGIWWLNVVSDTGTQPGTGNWVWSAATDWDNTTAYTRWKIVRHNSNYYENYNIAIIAGQTEPGVNPNWNKVYYEEWDVTKTYDKFNSVVYKPRTRVLFKCIKDTNNNGHPTLTEYWEYKLTEEWKPGHIYTNTDIGKLIRIGVEVYKILQAHTSVNLDENNVINDTNNDPPGQDTINYEWIENKTWDNSENYKLDNYVFINILAFKCIKNGTIDQHPDIKKYNDAYQYWNMIELWDLTKQYNTNDVVYYGDYDLDGEPGVIDQINYDFSNIKIFKVGNVKPLVGEVPGAFNLDTAGTVIGDRYYSNTGKMHVNELEALPFYKKIHHERNIYRGKWNSPQSQDSVWNISQTYNSGEKVIYNKRWWICKLDNNIGNEPKTTFWDITTNYTEDDIVVHNNVYYKHKVGNSTNKKPDLYTNNWDEITEIPWKFEGITETQFKIYQTNEKILETEDENPETSLKWSEKSYNEWRNYKSYNKNTITVHNDIFYLNISNETLIAIEPNTSEGAGKWSLINKLWENLKEYESAELVKKVQSGYLFGDIVEADEYELYQVKGGETSLGDAQNPTITTKWVKIVRNIWEDGETYGAYNVVLYQKNTYINKSGSNLTGIKPGTDDTKWQPSSNDYANTNDKWSALVQYSQYNIVQYPKKKLYMYRGKHMRFKNSISDDDIEPHIEHTMWVNIAISKRIWKTNTFYNKGVILKGTNYYWMVKNDHISSTDPDIDLNEYLNEYYMRLTNFWDKVGKFGYSGEWNKNNSHTWYDMTTHLLENNENKPEWYLFMMNVKIKNSNIKAGEIPPGTLRHINNNWDSMGINVNGYIYREGTYNLVMRDTIPFYSYVIDDLKVQDNYVIPGDYVQNYDGYQQGLYKLKGDNWNEDIGKGISKKKINDPNYWEMMHEPKDDWRSAYQGNYNSSTTYLEGDLISTTYYRKLFVEIDRKFTDPFSIKPSSWLDRDGEVGISQTYRELNSIKDDILTNYESEIKEFFNNFNIPYTDQEYGNWKTNVINNKHYNIFGNITTLSTGNVIPINNTTFKNTLFPLDNILLLLEIGRNDILTSIGKTLEYLNNNKKIREKVLNVYKKQIASDNLIKEETYKIIDKNDKISKKLEEKANNIIKEEKNISNVIRESELIEMTKIADKFVNNS